MIDLLHQGGYAEFVWGAYGVAALLVGGEVAMLVRRARRARPPRRLDEAAR